MSDVLEGRVCKGCGIWKEAKHFYRNKRFKGGLNSQCKGCYNSARMEAHHRKSSEDKRASRVKSDMNYRYGITPEEFEQMKDAQKNLCAICGREPWGDSFPQHKLHVDHCHNGGGVRGLLCYACNIGIGKFHEDIDNMKRAIGHLNRHNKAPSE